MPKTHPSSINHQMVRTGKLIAASPDPTLHVLNQGFREVAPSAVQSEVFRFVVVTALHREGGEGPQRQQVCGVNT